MQKRILYFVAITFLFFGANLFISPVKAQNTKFTIDQILRSVAAINQATGNQKKALSDRIINDVRKRQVDFPLTRENEMLLRSKGATDELIETIRENSPDLAIPTNLLNTARKSEETALWKTIQNSSNINDFESYLLRFRKGEFIGIYEATAEVKIGRLKKANAAAGWTKFLGTARFLLKYDWVADYSEGLYKVQLKSKWGLIDAKGKDIFPVNYDFIYVYKDLIAAKSGNNYGVLDLSGKEILPFKYDYIWDSGNGKFSAKLNGKYGVIDKNRNELIPFQYDEIKYLAKDLYSVAINKKSGVWDVESGKLVSLNFDKINPFSEDLARVETKDKKGFIDKTGKVVIPLEFDTADEFSDGLARVCLKNASGDAKCGYIDKTGKEAIPLKYENAGIQFTENRAWLKINGKWGALDISGKEIISFKYEDFYNSNMWKNFSPEAEGFAAVRLGSKWGFIDRSGREIIPFKYDSVESFTNGIALVELNGKFGFIDKNGDEVIPVKFDKFSSAGGSNENEATIKSKDGKWGFINRSAKTFVSPKYDKFWTGSFLNGFRGVILNGKKGFVDIYGNEYFDF